MLPRETAWTFWSNDSQTALHSVVLQEHNASCPVARSASRPASGTGEDGLLADTILLQLVKVLIVCEALNTLIKGFVVVGRSQFRVQEVSGRSDGLVDYGRARLPCLQVLVGCWRTVRDRGTLTVAPSRA